MRLLAVGQLDRQLSSYTGRAVLSTSGMCEMIFLTMINHSKYSDMILLVHRPLIRVTESSNKNMNRFNKYVLSSK